jgi:DNA polymerase, archaea type
MEFYLTDMTYQVIDNKPVILLFGKSNNKQICLLDYSFEPYFYAITDDELRIEQDGFRITRTEDTTRKIRGEETKLKKICINLPQGVPVIKRILKEKGIAVYEHDIFFTRRYLLDKEITPFTCLEVEKRETDFSAKVPSFEVTSIRQKSDLILRPTILAFDIETYHTGTISPEEHPVLMIALAGSNFRKVLTWKHIKGEHVEVLQTEADMLQRFVEIIEEQQPDILAGYFTDGFDFPYLKERAKKYALKLTVGLDYSEVIIKGKTKATAQITGIAHFDVFKFIRVIRRSLKTDVYSLNAVAHELLGEKKLEVDLMKLHEAWDTSTNLERFADYNLKDADITFKLATKLLPNILELIKLVGMSFFDMNRMSFSQLVEWFIIKQTKDEIILNKPSYYESKERMHRRFKGAFVLEPTPGLYKDIVVVDYRSMYPTIIASHNISLETFQCSCCSDKVPLEGEDYWFCKKKKGFISKIIEDLITKRAVLKSELKLDPDNPLLNARSIALKDMANSFYGYLGFAPARWYCFECGESVTAYARFYIKKVITKAKDAGFNVLYSDTDSCFMTLGTKSKKDAFNFVENVNKELPGLMELEFEKYYASGIFVGMKGSEGGAKKKYALIDEKNKLKITGFEAIRRNWSYIAKEVQLETLRIILEENDSEKAVAFVKGRVQDILGGKVPVEKMVIRTQLQKEISSYKSVGPHVVAAQLLKAKGTVVAPGMMIHYVIVKGVGKIRDKVALPEDTQSEDIDAEYYIAHQIIPSVEPILAVLGIDTKSIFEKESQSSLAGFF